MSKIYLGKRTCAGDSSMPIPVEHRGTHGVLLPAKESDKPSTNIAMFICDLCGCVTTVCHVTEEEESGGGISDG